MAQILKFYDGGVTSKQTELNDIAQWTQELQEYMSSPEADPNTVSFLSQYASNIQNYIANSHLNKRDIRKLQHNALQLMKSQVDGTSTYNPADVNVARLNFFGNYRNGDVSSAADANQMWKLTLNGNSSIANAADNAAQATSTPTSTTSTDGGLNYYNYDWKSGRDYNILPANTSFADRLKMVLSGMKEAATNLQGAKQANRSIYNISPENVDYVVSKIGDIDSLLANMGTQDDDTNFNQFLNLINNGKFEIDADELASIFPERYNGTSSSDNGYKAATDSYNNAKFTNWLNGRNLKLYTKDGKTFALDADMNPGTGWEQFIYDDPDNANYDMGLFVDQYGQIHYGKIDDILNNEYDPYYNIAKDAVAKIADSAPYVHYTFDAGNTTDDELLKRVSNLADYKGKKFHYYDVSKMFEGDTPVLAISADGSEIPFDRYGNFKDRDKVTFFYIDPTTKKLLRTLSNGNLGKTFKRRGYDNEELEQIGINTPRNTTYRTHPTKVRINTTIYNDLKPDGDLGKLVTAFTKAAKQAEPLSSKDEELLNKYGFAEGDIAGIAAGILRLLEKLRTDIENSKMSQEQRDLYRQQYNQYYPTEVIDLIYNKYVEAAKQERAQQVTINKEGGILFAKEGAKYNAWGERIDTESKVSSDEDITTDYLAENVAKAQQAKAAGFSNYDAYIRGNETLNQNFTTSDTLRIAALAQDIAGIVTNIIPTGATQIASAGLGLSSTGTQFAADMIDPSVSKKELWGNALMGLGLSALALVPEVGAASKIARTFKTVARYIPRLVGAMAAANVAIDDNIHKSLGKVMSGKFTELNHQDLRNLSIFMTTAAGLVKGGVNIKRSYNKVGPNGERIRDLTKRTALKTEHTVTDKSGNKHVIDDRDYKKVLELLGKEDGETKAKNLLKTLTGVDDFEFSEKTSTRSLVGRMTGAQPEKTLTLKSQKQTTEGYDWDKIADTLDILWKDENGRQRHKMRADEYMLLRRLGINVKSSDRRNVIGNEISGGGNALIRYMKNLKHAKVQPIRQMKVNRSQIVKLAQELEGVHGKEVDAGRLSQIIGQKYANNTYDEILRILSNRSVFNAQKLSVKKNGGRLDRLNAYVNQNKL